MAKNYILNKEVASRKLRRMALEIIENNYEETELVMAGVEENGVVIAGIIKDLVESQSAIRVTLIRIRLDKRHPTSIETDQLPALDNKVLIIVDDVSSSGKTLLYSLKPFLDQHPRKIQTLILVERSHTSFPVRPDYTGLSISSTLQEHIFVEVEDNQVTGAYLA